MAATNGYAAMQSSAMYLTDGDMIDWMYGTPAHLLVHLRALPARRRTPGRHYPPDEVIGRETRRNRDAVLYLMAKAACPWSALGSRGGPRHCGP